LAMGFINMNANKNRKAKPTTILKRRSVKATLETYLGS